MIRSSNYARCACAMCIHKRINAVWPMFVSHTAKCLLYFEFAFFIRLHSDGKNVKKERRSRPRERGRESEKMEEKQSTNNEKKYLIINIIAVACWLSHVMNAKWWICLTLKMHSEFFFFTCYCGGDDHDGCSQSVSVEVFSAVISLFVELLPLLLPLSVQSEIACNK